MGGYYVYVIGPDGHVQDRISFFCRSDQEAKSRAKQMVDGHAVELWQEARKIAVFKPDD
jgi:hypothetical protein